jgi:inner membrane protease subunit SOM1
MPPPLPVHSLSDLESQINVLPNGKARKPPVKLSDCALKELVQYKCNISIPKGDKKKPPIIVCEPVVRLLRQ